MSRSIFTLIAIVGFSFLIAGCVAAAGPNRGSFGSGSDFESCARAGGRVLKTFPPRCVEPDGTMHEKSLRRSFGGTICQDRCGDGACQQIVCMGENCPCSENPVTCSADCVATME